MGSSHGKMLSKTETLVAPKQHKRRSRQQEIARILPEILVPPTFWGVKRALVWEVIRHLGEALPRREEDAMSTPESNFPKNKIVCTSHI